MQLESLPSLQLVVPCYNEEQVLPITASTLVDKIRSLIDRGMIAPNSGIVFVDDGSTDASWELISEWVLKDSLVSGIKLARNFGHQCALFAGLMELDADIAISIDADLQDDVDAIDLMLEKHVSGCDIVYGVRSDRSSDSWFKRVSADLHYRLLARLGVDMIPHHADFRLMSSRALAFLSQYKEANLYLRGVVPLLGLPSTTVTYKRQSRAAGETKYPLAKMLSLSLHGVTSFSVAPLRFIAATGLLVFLVALVLGGWALFAAIFTDATAPGWASTVIPIYLLGGLQLLSLGVVGEYLGKTFIESKERPRYFIEHRNGKHFEGPGR